jgi:type VI secretion system secreted protein Hcp
MRQDDSNETDEPGTRAVANRRDVLLGATGIAVAAATGTMFGGGVAHAAPASGPLAGEIVGLGTFEVLTFSWGASSSGSLHMGGGGGAGKANFQDLSLTKYVDELSPALIEALAEGRHFTEASLRFAPAKGKSPLVLAMTQVLVTSVSLGGSASESQLTENVTLNFARFRYSYGQSVAGWDISGNVAK